MDKSLTDFYDGLKSGLAQDQPARSSNMNIVTPGSPGAVAWRNQAARESEKLKEGCYKRIILDMYCKIIPLDSDYVAGNQGQMKSDIDSFLANKGMTATQYLTSCHEKTNAPLLEFILRSGNTIGKEFMKEASETLKDAQENNINVPPPQADLNSEENQNALVDIQDDNDYKSFIEKLKEKTINKIVTDVSKIITDKKEEKEMTFNPNPVATTESTVSVVMDYLNYKFMKENVEISSDMQEEMIGLAIRESTLNQLDTVFKQPDSELRLFASRIRLGKGVLVNESAVSYFIESGGVAKRYEPLYKETDGSKYDVSNHEKVGKDGKKTPMTDAEAKKVLDPEGYKSFQNKKSSKETSVNESSMDDESFSSLIDMYMEDYKYDYQSAINYYSESGESTSSNKFSKAVRAIIKKIKEFLNRILGPLLRKALGKTEANDKAVIAKALRSVNINPKPQKDDKHKEKVTFAFDLEQRDGKNYFVGMSIIDLYHIRDEIVPKLQKGIPVSPSSLKGIYGEKKVNKISVEEYKDIANGIMDAFLEIEKKVMENTEISESGRGKMLNSLLIISNQINMFLHGLSNALATDIDPLTESALAALSDFPKIASFLAQIQKESPNNVSILKQCLTRICKYNNWTYGSGTARFFIPDPNDGQYGYKFAYTKKGINDNHREHDIWKRLHGRPVTKHLIPIIDISSDGMMLKVAKASDVGKVSDSVIKDFAKNVDKMEKDMELTGDVDIAIKILGCRISIMTNKGNVGMYKGSPVIIDYANSFYNFKNKK